MKKLIAIAAIALCGCTQQDTARRILEDAGYTNVQLQGYAFLACSEDDTYHDAFTATNPNGRHVSGTVCAGMLFKNSTIRFD